MESYCLRCKKKVEALDLKFYKTNSKNGIHLHKGKCGECNAGVIKLLKDKIQDGEEN